MPAVLPPSPSPGAGDRSRGNHRSNASTADRIEHGSEAAPPQQLARKQVMALQAGIITGPPAVIDRMKGNPLPVRHGLRFQAPRQTRMSLPKRDGSSTSISPDGPSSSRGA